MTIKMHNAVLHMTFDGLTTVVGELITMEMLHLVEEDNAALEHHFLYGRGGGKSTAFNALQIRKANGMRVTGIILDEIAAMPKEYFVHDMPIYEEPRHIETKQERVARLRGVRW